MRVNVISLEITVLARRGVRFIRFSLPFQRLLYQVRSSPKSTHSGAMLRDVGVDMVLWYLELVYSSGGFMNIFRVPGALKYRLKGELSSKVASVDTCHGTPCIAEKGCITRYDLCGFPENSRTLNVVGSHFRDCYHTVIHASFKGNVRSGTGGIEE